MMNRRTLLAAPALLGMAAAARAETAYPDRAIRLVVPFAAGGTTDLAARLLSEALPRELGGQTIVVDNRPGAGGNIGAAAVAHAAPDGYTLLMTTIGIAAINPTLYTNLPYKPSDLTAVSHVVSVANVLFTRTDLGVSTTQELIALLKEKEGELNYGSPGNGTSGHLCTEYFMSKTGTKAQHVPFRGSGPMLIEMMGGRVDFAFDNLPSALAHIQSGKIKALAVTTPNRWFALPDAPTVAESAVPGFDATAWFGVQAPASTPRPIVEKLASSIDKVLKNPDTARRLRELGGEPVGGTAAEFQTYIDAENTKWSEVVRTSGAQID